MKSPILVTQPFLPPLEEMQPYLEDIWQRKWLTNNGHHHQELEKALAEYLGVPHVSLFANGTLALLTALQALDIQGEVITTPFTFVASTHALVWNNITPVFADVEEDYCNLDPAKVEALITDKTTAIMPVHVYGNPCDHKALAAIAEKHNLKLIYDAAHAFGVKEQGESVLNYGDLSVLSFHATKVFHTFEGGAIVSHTAEMKQHIDDLKNFGFRGETKVILPGINGKMNEVQAAMGLLQLKYADENLEKRRQIAERYRQAFADVAGITPLEVKTGVEHNGAYFPIFVSDDFALTRDELYEQLKSQGIFGRRYFYPLVTDFEAYQHCSRSYELPVAKAKSEQVLCLPIYPDLPMDEVEWIVENILNIQQ